VPLAPLRDLLTRKAEYQARKEELNLNTIEIDELIGYSIYLVNAAAF
jgi:hypothetical protein